MEIVQRVSGFNQMPQVVYVKMNAASSIIVSLVFAELIASNRPAETKIERGLQVKSIISRCFPSVDRWSRQNGVPSIRLRLSTTRLIPLLIWSLPDVWHCQRVFLSLQNWSNLSDPIIGSFHEFLNGKGTSHMLSCMTVIMLHASISFSIYENIMSVVSISCRDYLETPSMTRRDHLPMWMFKRESNNPKTFNSHNTTAMTTTAFRIFLIVACIGM